ncbi:MAG: fluoride efflux transporter CrcB [Bacteroidales bacterium]|nr:fluoride efflux transporter CrcB [Bacteroidales bacterium]
MLRNILIVGIGSFLGGVLRYLISIVMKNYCSQGFPWATLLVNLMGCFLIGLIFGLFNRYSSINNVWCLLFTTGLCGGFTTFSTFANEGLQLLSSGNIWGFVFYVSVSVILGVALVALAYWLVR